MLNYGEAKAFLLKMGIINQTTSNDIVEKIVNGTVKAAATAITVPAEEVVQIWTDGSCKGNPGIGGYAAVMLYKGHRREISGANESTTNNRMELTAVIEALKALKKPCAVEIHSDSAYVLGGIENLIVWRRRGWKTAAGAAAKNVDLWKQVDELLKTRTLNYKLDKVRGHSNVEENERCDTLAKEAAEALLAEVAPSDIEVPEIPPIPEEVA